MSIGIKVNLQFKFSILVALSLRSVKVLLLASFLICPIRVSKTLSFLSDYITHSIVIMYIALLDGVSEHFQPFSN